MIQSLLRLFAMLCTACICGKAAAKLKLPAILGWLAAGIVFGPYLGEIVTFAVTDALWYKVLIKLAECFAGVMIGREMLFQSIARSGKQIVGITFVQSIGTFLFVSLAFAIVFAFAGLPVYLAFIFGGIALATAPAPALSIVNEYHTDGPVTKTLIPLAVLDDVIGVAVFFTVITVVKLRLGAGDVSVLPMIGMVVLPFVIGILTGLCGGFLMKRCKGTAVRFAVFFAFLCLSALIGLAVDGLVYHAFSLNYLLIGMAYSATVANLVPADALKAPLALYAPVLNVSLVAVIVNLGMPLDYRLIAGAGMFTAIYILSRAVGKIGGAFLGGKLTKAAPTVTKYLGFTLLPHSGVSLIFTGIAVTTLSAVDAPSASVISGTIAAAAILNEIVAVITARFAFQWAGEIQKPSDKRLS
ncbi:MAG: cation:proton antiporter [Eubacteriales bacterium]